jgi:hypothetical protein
MRSLFKHQHLEGAKYDNGLDYYLMHGIFIAGRLIYRFKETVLRRSNTEPYLVRYSLITTKWFSLKLHNILSSDDECLHDHPWAYMSILLKGRYIEESETGFKAYGRGAVLVRRAKWKHRLHIGKPVWSLVITFRKTREWGFWTRKGFIHWKEYDSKYCD